jgi:hypothetical protein
VSLEKQSKHSSYGGKREGAGRKPGVPNKLSASVKDNVIAVFNDLNGDNLGHMKDWAMENPTQFYNLYGKLLPVTLQGDAENPVVHAIKLVPLTANG